MRLAISTSPSRGEQRDAAHLAQVHAHRIVGATGLVRVVLVALGHRATARLALALASGPALAGGVRGNHLDALGDQQLLPLTDLRRVDEVGGKQAGQLVVGDAPLLLAEVDELLLELVSVNVSDGTGLGHGNLLGSSSYG